MSGTARLWLLPGFWLVNSAVPLLFSFLLPQAILLESIVNHPKKSISKLPPWADFLMVSLLLSVFSLTATGVTWWALICLLVFQLHAVSRLGSLSLKGIAQTIGLVKSKNMIWWLLAAGVLALAMAIFYRGYTGMSKLPEALMSFSIIAVLIGIVEELVFRGYLMWLSRFGGAWGAIFLCALAHASYKVLLFVPVGDNDLLTLGFFTFLVGIVLGLMRQKSKSLYPCILFHAVFDLVVYGDGGTPWWVW